MLLIDFDDKMDASVNSFAVTEAVNELLKENDFPASLTIEQCAMAMSTSMTSFRRKLAKEETSYKLIQSKFLNQLCVHNLLTQQANIDDLAITLGYSERATFERSFRQKFGVTPSQFRELSSISTDNESSQNLTQIAQQLPPMPNSCRQLLNDKDSDNLDVTRVVEIVKQDPILSGRVMGQASMAIYGKTPKDLHEAISRNLGINTVVNFAVVYAMKDALQKHVSPVIIDQYAMAFMLAPKLFRTVRKLISKRVTFDVDVTEQILVFAMLGVFLLSHKKAYKHKLVLHSLQGIEDLQTLNDHIKESMGLSLYAGSSLMLSLWHIDATIVKQLNRLDKVSQRKMKGSDQDELVLFMLSCLYAFASEHQDLSDLEQKSDLLGIDDFYDIKALITSVN
jgi:AraC-like DNA-binding protein